MGLGAVGTSWGVVLGHLPSNAAAATAAEVLLVTVLLEANAAASRKASSMPGRALSSAGRPSAGAGRPCSSLSETQGAQAGSQAYCLLLNME